MRGVQAQLLLRRGLWDDAATIAHEVIDDEATTALEGAAKAGQCGLLSV